MKLILFIFRFFLSLRYRVKIIGTENLKHNGPVLILPNHVALVDPEILIVFLGKYLDISPLASEKYYNKPGLKQAMDLVGTIPIGEMIEGANLEDIKKSFKQIISGLKNNRNILIYPSGQVYRQGYESIIGKQSVYNVVNLMPENTKVIGIKTRGLWGSMFSMAWNNGKTSFFITLLKGIKVLFLNLLFFTPKRDVNIQIVDITKDVLELKKDHLNVLNKYLENLYNTENGESYIEKTRFIKHYFYYDDVIGKEEPNIISGSLKELNLSVKRDISSVDSTIISKIFDKISLMKSISKDNIKSESNLVLDLFLDSLDLAEIKSYIQSNFEKSSNPPILDLKTVGDLVFMAIGQSNNEEKLKPCEWGKDFSGNLMLWKLGKTILNEK